MPKLVRLYIVSVAIGACLAVIFTGLLLLVDVAGLRHLTMSTRGGWLAIFMLIAFHTILFSGVQFAYCVMRLAQNDGPAGGKRLFSRRAATAARAWAHVLVAAKRR